MPSYRSFARFYDAVQGDRTDEASFLRGLIDRHHPSARTVLELACGTGSILAQLRPDYEVTGLDVSPEMLELAAANVPDVRLVEADMTQFQLSERFDVVLCVFDSINHLLDFSEWESVFARSREHLSDGGIFVFDANTARQLATLAGHPPLVRWFGDAHLLVIDVRYDACVATWDIAVFEHRERDRYVLHTESIREVAFPADRIEQSLRAWFRSVSTYDRSRPAPSPDSERIHFVAAS